VAECTKAVELAHECLTFSEEEHESLRLEVLSMEQALASSAPASAATPVEDAMTQLALAMKSIMSSISTNRVISSDLAQEAQSHCNHLLVGLQATIQAAEQLTDENGPNRKLSGKQSVEVEQIDMDTELQLPLLRRAVVKGAPAKRTMGDFFNKAPRKTARPLNRFQHLATDGNETA
jgi:hypothetical protein